MLQVRGKHIVDAQGKTVYLRGTCIGGWMNMENLINGYPGDERGIRRAMAQTIGEAKAQFFFDRMLDYLFAEEDVAFIKACGANVVRLPLNYRHFESDAAPFKYIEAGFRRLDQAVKWCTQYGIYVILDLHAVQGFQNTDWHCDNSSRHTFFWTEKQYQDRFVALWEEFARRYKGNHIIAGYNVMNEPLVNAPAGRFTSTYIPDWDRMNALYRRAVNAIRAIDPHHIIFLEGDYFSQLFDGLDAPFTDNLVYSSHNYTRAGHGPGKYPGVLPGEYFGDTIARQHAAEPAGEYWDKAKLREVFYGNQGTQFAQKYNVPLWSGEFGAKIDGPREEWDDRCRSLDDQLAIFDEFGAHWTIWTYKDVGRQGWVILDPQSEYMQRLAGIARTKKTLGLETWWTGGHKGSEFQATLDALIASIEQIIGDSDINHRANEQYLGQALLGGYVSSLMQPTYAKLFAGLSENELDRILQAFALKNCRVHAGKTNVLKKYMRSS
jgi:aryl-phospho-beta-D-glucosidase BglC (GH1 family)